MTGGLDETLEFLEGEMTKKKAPATGTKPKRPAHYKQKECPYCHAMVGNLGNHVQMKHPNIAGERLISKDDLLGVPVRNGKLPENPENIQLRLNEEKLHPPVYYCQDCRAELRKGESQCWQCGAAWDWSEIE